ncbi:hypothetical protein BLNAU_11457 [Blattamonas nauphoetae]|uniref:Uncharacterized protein n=1 Tax=Blattamonas nauphoetae TaxID=2049346 RepID=A0ABQ9XMF3_9EUKA|nr:hypothetical protein BLNAU_11457 [Blattamonas nauphoetae]
MSLVDFIKEGNTLDETGTQHACALLERIIHQFGSSFSSDQILFELAPKPDGSCSGFAESIVLLLRSSNEELVKSTLSLLNGIMIDASYATRFDFIATGFFVLLPKSFYEHDMHLLTRQSFFLMRIVKWFVSCSEPSSTRSLCQERNISLATFEQTFMDKYFHPIHPFLESICTKRHQIEDCEDSYYFSELIATLLTHAPFLDQMTQSVLSSPLAVAFADSLAFFETHIISHTLIYCVLDGIRGSSIGGRAFRKRCNLVVAQLREESLDDEIELHLQKDESDFMADRYVFVEATLLHTLGGNVPFLQRAFVLPQQRDPLPHSSALLCTSRHEPTNIESVQQASPPFMSLVNFIKEGNTLDETGTQHACALLERIIHQFGSSFSSDQILFELAPKPDGSCSGFFDLLPKSFYEHAMHISTRTTLTGSICRQSLLSTNTVHAIYITKFFRPVEPFLNFILKNQHRFEDSVESRDFSRFLGTLIEHSPFVEQMAGYTLSSSFALVFTERLLFFETTFVREPLIQCVMSGISEWQNGDADVRKRGLEILAKLQDEGISDEIELFFRISSLDLIERRRVFQGELLMHRLGGNIPF